MKFTNDLATAAAILELAAKQHELARGYVADWTALTRAGVPLAHRALAIRLFARDRSCAPKETEPLRAVMAWVAQPSRPLKVVVSTPGPGKSFAAACWLLALARGGQSGKWLSFADFATAQLYPERGSDIPDRKSIINRINNAAALVIDDLGVSIDRPGRDAIEALVIARTDQGWQSLVLSNLSPQQTSEALGPRLMSRLGGELTCVGGRDLRIDAPPLGDDLANPRKLRRAKWVIDVLAGGATSLADRWQTWGRWTDAAEKLIADLGLERAATVKRARELDATCQPANLVEGKAVIARLARALVVELTARDRAARERYEQARPQPGAGPAKGVRQAGSSSPPGDERRALLERVGFTVRRHAGGFVLTWGQPGSRRGRPLTRDKFLSQPAAWAAANELFEQGRLDQPESKHDARSPHQAH